MVILSSPVRLLHGLAAWSSMRLDCRLVRYVVDVRLLPESFPQVLIAEKTLLFELPSHS